MTNILFIHFTHTFNRLISHSFIYSLNDSFYSLVYVLIQPSHSFNHLLIHSTNSLMQLIHSLQLCIH